MPTLTLTLDSVSNARSLALIPVVQANYNAAGYPSLTITQAYILTFAIRVGLNWWVLPEFYSDTAFGVPPNQPTTAKLTPTLHGTVQYVVVVPAPVAAYANDIAALLGVAQVDVLGCALCTGLAMISGAVEPGSPDGSPQVGPFLYP